MWFRLTLDSCQLAALVGSNGIVYWRVCDIARLLKKTHPTEMARRYANGNVVRSNKVAFLPVTDVLLLSTRDAYEMMIKINPTIGNLFFSALKDGKATVRHADGLTSSLVNSPHLVLEDGSPHLVREWIIEYRSKVLNAKVPKNIDELLKVKGYMCFEFRNEPPIKMGLYDYVEAPDAIRLFRDDDKKPILYKRM